MPTMLVLGATSDIARATALAFGLKGWDLHLAGRNVRELERIADDLAIRTERKVVFSFFDALHPEPHEAFWREHAESVDGVFCAVGLLGDQQMARQDMALADRILRSNFTGLVPVLSMAANSFEARGAGLIIGVSSVAGDRGRASNYIYGSAKAGLDTFLSGLRNRLTKTGVHVLTVRPGFVATGMTEAMELPARLTATPAQVAQDIVRAVEKKRNILYTRWYWQGIMWIIKHIPEGVFKRLKL